MSKDTTVIPVIEEALLVEKRVVASDGATISKHVHEHEEVIDELLHQERVGGRAPSRQPPGGHCAVHTAGRNHPDYSARGRSFGRRKTP